MKRNKLFLAIGIFLILDGIFSIYFGHSCLNECVNNNLFGDAVRLLRVIVGGYLIYKFR